MTLDLPDDPGARAALGAAGFDGRGGDSLLAVAIGFATGTPVATPEGRRPIETIVPGDTVAGSAGPRRVLWRRERRLDAVALARMPEFRPVMVAPGAWGPGVPQVELCLAPGQPMAIPGGAAPAAYLVDNEGFRRGGPGDGVRYVSLGLDRPGAVMAAGLACPGQNHDAAATAASWRRARGRRPGRLLGQVERAAAGFIEGWALDPDRPDAPVVLELCADGVAIAWVVADRRRPDLEMQGLGGGACAFALRFAAPAGARLLSLCRVEDGTELAGSPVLLLPPPPGPGLAAAIATAVAAAARRIDAAAAIVARCDDIAVASRLATSRGQEKYREE